MITNEKKYNLSLSGLDLLRFLLSLSVIVWHYQHFYQAAHADRAIYLKEQPFYKMLSLFYTNGAKAVPIFWIISGIVFYKFYFEQILLKKVSFKKFIINRFSRLYPLHFATLLIVAVLQYFYLKNHGEYFVYTHNSWGYFILNTLFIQNWFTTPDTLGSFNGPAWSVSIEIFIYLVFFLTSTTKKLNTNLALISMILIAMIFQAYGLGLFNFNECFYYFFAGCLLQKNIDKTPNIIKGAVVLLAYHIVHFLLQHYLGNVLPIKHFLYSIREFHGEMQFITGFLILVYLAIRAFSTKRIQNFNLKIFASLGNLTYSMYLVHFPVQITMFLIFNPSSYLFFNKPSTFILFLGTTIILGYLSFKYLEKPTQTKLRTAFKA